MTPGERLRAHREARGLTQAQLAAHAGVSRQLVGALEAGRHMPRVDAALGLATALGTDVVSLFGPEPTPGEVVTGASPVVGALVRMGRVGDRVVFTEAGVGAGGWDVADGVVEDGGIRLLAGSAGPGVVVAGCEPGLEVLERILRERGRGALAAGCSSAAALGALDAGRVHAAVVHGAPEADPAVDDVARFRLCSWRVGLAGPEGAGRGWAEKAIAGKVPVVQREPGAGVQDAFERVAGGRVDGPWASGHLESARMAVTLGLAAVTIEPAALALGAVFHPLETHHAELLVDADRVGEAGVEALLNEITGERFQRRLLGVGGYDLQGIGGRLR